MPPLGASFFGIVAVDVTESFIWSIEKIFSTSKTWVDGIQAFVSDLPLARGSRTTQKRI